MTALRHGAASDTGVVRTINQDASLVDEPLFAVADGMGGHAAGEVASQVAIDALRRNAEATADGLVHAIRVANRAVWEKSAAEPAMRGMGTTLCAIVLVPAASPGAEGADGGDTIVVANVGDSMSRMAAAGPRLRPMHKGGAMAGPALTVKVRPGDNLMLHRALDLAEPGDVIVAADGKPVDRVSTLQRVVRAHEPGETVARVRATAAVRSRVTRR